MQAARQQNAVTSTRPDPGIGTDIDDDDDISSEEFGEVAENFVVDYASLPLDKSDEYLDMVASMASPPDATYFVPSGIGEHVPYSDEERNKALLEVDGFFLDHFMDSLGVSSIPDGHVAA